MYSGHSAAKTFYVEEDWKSSCTLDTPARLKATLLSTTYYVTRTLTLIIPDPRRKAGIDSCLVILCEDSWEVTRLASWRTKERRDTNEEDRTNERTGEERQDEFTTGPLHPSPWTLADERHERSPVASSGEREMEY